MPLALWKWFFKSQSKLDEERQGLQALIECLLREREKLSSDSEEKTKTRQNESLQKPQPLHLPSRSNIREQFPWTLSQQMYTAELNW